MSNPDDSQTRRQVLRMTGGMLAAIGMGGVANAADASDSDAATRSAEPLSGRPDIRVADDRPGVEPMGGRPDIRSLSAEPLSGRPDIRSSQVEDDQDSDVGLSSLRPDVRS